jgi:hypothetical protein
VSCGELQLGHHIEDLVAFHPIPLISCWESRTADPEGRAPASGITRWTVPTARLLLTLIGRTEEQLLIESGARDPQHPTIFKCYSPEPKRGKFDCPKPTMLNDRWCIVCFATDKHVTRIDVQTEFVREAVLKGECDLFAQPLLRRILIGEWDRLGALEQFPAARGLSSPTWLAARRV